MHVSGREGERLRMLRSERAVTEYVLVKRASDGRDGCNVMCGGCLVDVVDRRAGLGILVQTISFWADQADFAFSSALHWYSLLILVVVTTLTPYYYKPMFGNAN